MDQMQQWVKTWDDRTGTLWNDRTGTLWSDRQGTLLK